MPALPLLVAALAQSPAAVTVPQLSQPRQAGAASIAGDASSPASPLAPGRGDLAAAPAQVGESARSVEPAPALSTRAQGRAVGTAAVGGRDRCDPASRAADSALCRGRVETRAGEFDAPAPAPVTAEGRLLLLTRPQGEPPMTPTGASRRLGGTAADVERAAGTAAGELAAAISQQQSTSNTQLTPNGGTPVTTPTSGVLPPGVPSVVVTQPR